MTVPIPRLVLDTNVLVSIMIFSDARHIAFRDAWQSGKARLLIDSACADELFEVMQRKQFKADLAMVEAARAALALEAEHIAAGAAPLGLPKCSDRDDQKFLELAARGQADALLTYDKALLKCRRKTVFKIETPEQYLARAAP